MNAGMLWFDNNPKTDLRTKIHNAINYYTDKYGHSPNTCIINPCMKIDLQSLRMDNIKVRTHNSILPNYFLISFEVQKTKQA